MASLSRDRQSGIYYIQFWLGERHLNKSLKTQNEEEAATRFTTIKQTLSDIERGRLVIPVGADPWHFIKTDGRQEQKPDRPKVLTLADLFKWFEGQRTPNAKQGKTVKTEGVHGRHFLRLLGGRTALTSMTAADLQRYINKRATERYKSRAETIKVGTIKKEIDTLRMVWNRAYRLGTAACPAPATDVLDYPVGREKPAFKTWEEIERIVARGGISKSEEREEWGSLFLRLDQIKELLTFVRTKKTRTHYLLPLMVFLAHTGARKSEAMRSRVEDIKLAERQVVIRERKRKKGMETFRFVPMTKLLHDTLRAYFRKGHPGGNYTFCREANEPMKESTLTEAFEWFFARSKWSVMKGYHVLRHSFASNLALKGVDQRVIDELMGHETEAMRRRYRHLFPGQRVDAIRRLFGG
jgi:site-specific recombinase XerD